MIQNFSAWKNPTSDAGTQAPSNDLQNFQKPSIATRTPGSLHARNIREIGGKDFVFRHTVLERTGACGERVWQAALDAPA